MTLPVNDRISQVYITDGTTKRFDFTFRLFSQDDADGIMVRKKTLLGFDSVDKNLYSVVGNIGDEGGYVMFSTAPVAGQFLYIIGSTAVEQSLSITNYGNFNAHSLERVLDKIIAILQERQGDLTQEQQARVVADVYYDDLAKVREEDLKNYVDGIIGSITGQPFIGIADNFIQVKQPFTGSIDRSQHDKNADTVSVKDFGAKGDGVTDDTVKILNAINAGVRNFSDGIYRITNFSLIQNIANYNGTVNSFFKYNNELLPIGAIVGFTALNVPSVFPTIADAVRFAENKLYQGRYAFCSVRIAPGTYGSTTSPIQQIEIAVPDGGDHIEIVGLSTDANDVVIYSDRSSNQCTFLAQRGHSVYQIANMRIIGVNGWISHGVWSTECFGAAIGAIGGSVINTVHNVKIEKCYYGISARDNSFIGCTPSCFVTAGGDVGVHAFNGSTIICDGMRAEYCAHYAPGLGGGFCAELGSSMRCEGSSTAHNNVAGYTCGTGSYMWAQNTDSELNERYGYFVNGGGSLVCESGAGVTTSSGNKLSGFFAIGSGSCIAANGAKSFGNNPVGITGPSHGFFATMGAWIEITATESYSNIGSGYHADNGGRMIGNASHAHDNSLNGYTAVWGSFIESQFSQSRNNSQFGYLADFNGLMKIKGYAVSGNVLGTTSPPLGEFSNLGSYIGTPD